MSRLESALKCLAQGKFVCEVQYPDEYATLQDPHSRVEVERWLETIGYRLARLHDEGAFFMAYAIPTLELRTRLREEMRTIRSRLEPIVGFMETLRQAQGSNPQLHAGDMLWESEISEAIRNSSLLQNRIADLKDISGVRVGDSHPDRVKRMLQQMVQDGYLIETNPTNKGYQITGKIDYLYQLIAFIGENTPHLSDESVVDQLDPQSRLDMPTTVENAMNTLA